MVQGDTQKVHGAVTGEVYSSTSTLASARARALVNSISRVPSLTAVEISATSSSKKDLTSSSLAAVAVVLTVKATFTPSDRRFRACFLYKNESRKVVRC